MIRKFLATLVFTVLPFSVSTAEDVKVFTGSAYDSEFGFTSVVGSVQHMARGLYTIQRATIGRYGTVETDIAYMFNIEKSAFSVGLLAGPNADFIDNNDDGVGPTAYIVGAAGGILSYQPIGKAWGLHGAAKYKFSLEGDNLYQDGWQGGLFISYQFGE